jgi:hypothetical protein
MNTQHTPEPWVVLGGNIRRVSANGDTTEPVLLDNPANARLIAAAPELFATLRDLVALARDPDASDFDADSLLSDAESLIERVTE